MSKDSYLGLLKEYNAQRDELEVLRKVIIELSKQKDPIVLTIVLTDEQYEKYMEVLDVAY